MSKKKKNPCVFMDLSIDETPAGRILIELFADIVPKTAENFRALCTGEKGIGKTTGKPLHYKGTVFYRIYQGVFAEGGDFENQNGTGGESIYGGDFTDENYKLSHRECGMLSMSHCNPNTNGSRFYIIFDRQPTFDWSHVVFGKVIEGMETVKKIETLGTKEGFNGKPSVQVKVANCGEIPEEDKKFVMKSYQGKKKKTRKSAKPSNSVSEFYSFKRKYASSKPSDSDSEFYSSLLIKLKDSSETSKDEKNNVIDSNIRCSGCPSYVAAVGFQETTTNINEKTSTTDFKGSEKENKQHESSVGDRSECRPSESSSAVYAYVLVKIARSMKIARDKYMKVMESDKGGEKEKTEKYMSSKSSNYASEFYLSKRKYWSSKSSNSYLEFYSSQRVKDDTNCGEILEEDKKNNLKGKKKETVKSDSEEFMSSNSYSSE